MPDRHAKPKRCPDCDAPAQDGAVYCSRCGQRLTVGPLRLREITTELASSLISWELPVLRTVRDLSMGPGRVADAWMRGQRRRYVNPFHFLVVVGLVVALTYGPLHRARAARIPSGQAIYEVGLAHHASQYFAFFCIALLLPLAVALALIGRFFALRRTWVEWYLLGLYAYGLGAVLQLVILAAAAWVPGVATLPALPLLEFFVPVLLFCWGALSFVERQRRWHALGASALAHALIAAVLIAVQYAR